MNNNIEKNLDLKEECKFFMAEHGLEPDEIISDGRIKRYSVDGNGQKKDEWYVAHEGISLKGNSYFTCIFESWIVTGKLTFFF